MCTIDINKLSLNELFESNNVIIENYSVIRELNPDIDLKPKDNKDILIIDKETNAQHRFTFDDCFWETDDQGREIGILDWQFKSAEGNLFNENTRLIIELD